MIDVGCELRELVELGYSKKEAFDKIKKVIEERKNNIVNNKAYENNDELSFIQKSQRYNR